MKTILVADDEFDMLGTLRALLEAEGYRVETCTNGREALDRLGTSPPDLLLMDVMMPILSGFEVLQAMRRMPNLDTLPVILMSSVLVGLKRDEYRWQEFLRKPFSLEALTSAVEKLIGAPEGARPQA